MYSYGSFQNYWDIIKALDGITQYGANFVLETALKQIDTEYQANSTIGLSTLLFITSIANSNLTAAKPYADSLRSKGRLTFITVSMQQNDIANLSRLADQIINWDASNFYYPPDALSQLQNAFDCPAQPPFAFNFTQCRTTYANYFMFDASNDLNETDFQNQKQFFLDNLYTTISPIVSPMLYLYGYDNVSANYVSCDQYDMLCIPAMTQQIIQTNNTPSFYNAMYQTSDYRRAVNFIIFISSTPADWEIQQSISILNSILSYNGRVIVVSNNDQVDQSQLLKLNGISIAPYQENRMEQGEIIRKQMTCQ
uniref:Uncharacterized protein n=1 Tax=Acrobeloides nanus TaxID=290746 RepID=A0A914BZ99_9BILA